jgi:hypothetical protein
VPALSAYGLPLGDAFQLRDDVLGAFGDSGLTGKPVGDDLREGKPTPLLAIATGRATPAQPRCWPGWAPPTCPTPRWLAIQEVLVATGALAELETEIEQLADRGGRWRSSGGRPQRRGPEQALTSTWPTTSPGGRSSRARGGDRRRPGRALGGRPPRGARPRRDRGGARGRARRAGRARRGQGVPLRQRSHRPHHARPAGRCVRGGRHPDGRLRHLKKVDPMYRAATRTAPSCGCGTAGSA